MAELSVELVTPERRVLVQDGVDVLIAPAVEGQIAVLPRHAALITELEPGVMILRSGDEVHAEPCRLEAGAQLLFAGRRRHTRS